MGKCQNRSFRFPNLIRRSPPLLRIITHEAAVSEFAQAAFFSFLFSLRAQSETIALRRASPSGLLGDFPPQKEKARIGARFSGGPLFSCPNLLGVRIWSRVVLCGAPVSSP